MNMEDLVHWATEDRIRGTVLIRFYVQPSARCPGLAGEFGGALKLKVAAPPVEGAANDAVQQWIVQKLGIKAALVCLISGHTSRSKVFEVIGMTLSEIRQKLLL